MRNRTKLFELGTILALTVTMGFVLPDKQITLNIIDSPTKTKKQLCSELMNIGEEASISFLQGNLLQIYGPGTDYPGARFAYRSLSEEIYSASEIIEGNKRADRITILEN